MANNTMKETQDLKSELPQWFEILTYKTYILICTSANRSKLRSCIGQGIGIDRRM